MMLPHTVSVLALMVAAFASLAGVHGHATMLVRASPPSPSFPAVQHWTGIALTRGAQIPQSL